MRKPATITSALIRACEQSGLRVFLLAMIIFMFGLSVQAQQIKQSVIAGGGGKSAAETRQVEGTIGQSLVGTSNGGAFKVEGGFWPGGPVATVSVVSLDSASGIYGGTVTLRATLSASGAGLNGKLISFTLNSSAVGTATTGNDGVATLSNVSLSGVNVGVYPGAVTAQFAGDAEFTVSIGSGELMVSKADQIINFSALGNQAFGAAPFTVSATATSGLPVTFSIESGPASLAGNTVTINGAGTVVVRAAQVGDENYNPATPVDQSFQVLEDVPCNKLNVALALHGAKAIASSEYNANFPARGVIDGEHDGNNWALGGGWNDATWGVYPDSVEVRFAGAETIDEIVVYTLKDNYNSGSVVDEATLFTKYGITAFQVQYWNGAEFVDVPGGVVTGNNQVKRRFSFAKLTTDKIRIVVNDGGSDLGYYSRVVEVEAYACKAVPPPCANQTNVALAAAGSTATASSEYNSAFPVSGVIDGEHDGNNWGSGGGWNDATAGLFPDSVAIDFHVLQTISEIVVYTLKDDYNSGNMVTDATQFTWYGIRNFTVEYWNGSDYVAVPGGVVTGNTQVKRRFVFPELTTERIRVVVNDGSDNLGFYSRVVEVEAYACNPSTPPSAGLTNVALAAVGAIATASSEYSSAFPASGVIDGEHDGNNWGLGGGWNDGTSGLFPDSIEVRFNGSQTLREIVVYTLKDDYNSGTLVGNDTQFTMYGISNFQVQYWTGTEWLDIPGGVVTDNRQVKRRFVFPELTTERIRVVVQDAPNNAGHHSRIVEIQAFKL